MTLVVDDDFDFSILHHPNTRIRGAEINADDWVTCQHPLAAVDRGSGGGSGPTITKLFPKRGLLFLCADPGDESEGGDEDGE